LIFEGVGGGVITHKNWNSQNKERRQYAAILQLTKQVWSVQDLLYGFGEIFLAGHGGSSQAGKIAPTCPLR